MSGTIFLQIFLVTDVFIVGALAATTARHYYDNIRPAKEAPEAPPVPPIDVHLPPALREHLLHDSQVKFQKVLDGSADLLQQDLGVTAEHINNMVNRLATEIVGSELERYRTELSRLHSQAQVDMSGIKTGLTAHQEELKAKMAQEIQAEKLQLVKQIDTKLGDAVSSFLLETLGHNVDLGSQATYLVGLLEEHKAEFKKEVAGDAQPPK